MLTLSRGGPTMWIGKLTRIKLTSKTTTGLKCLTQTAQSPLVPWVSQRVKEEHDHDVPCPRKTGQHPGSESTGTRGGIHNSVTRAVLKPLTWLVAMPNKPMALTTMAQSAVTVTNLCWCVKWQSRLVWRQTRWRIASSITNYVGLRCH